MPDVDSTLRTKARWKYLINTDLTKAIYQIPVAKDSMKFCGVVTPFRGVRVYTRCYGYAWIRDRIRRVDVPCVW